VPNNSLLYCSEKCKREDVLSSSPPLFYRSSSSYSGDYRFTSSTKPSTFEPSRKDQWGITPSPSREIPVADDSIYSSSSAGTSPTARPSFHRSSSARPLPPLHPRFGSSPRSMELVLPVYRETSDCSRSDAKSLDYGRRIVEANATSSGGLKKLFHFKELQASPVTPE
jgi:hypothetical protein